MGCKGKRRRERNYLKAHSEYTPLAPPPSAKDIEAIPSKLRRLLQLKNSAASTPKLLPRGGDGGHSQNKSSHSGDKKSRGKGNGKQNSATIADSKEKISGEIKKLNEELDNKQNVVQRSSVQSASSKRKRKRAEDLHLLMESQNLALPGKRKRDRKKRYLEKKKQKKAKNDDGMDFPQHEVIRFGEVVDSPPKLEFPKKASAEIKMRQDVSKERLRLQAIKTYRQRKGWTSRPGSYVPPLDSTQDLSEA